MAERKRGNWGLWMSVGVLIAAGGCSQDAERLARICHKTAARIDGVTEGVRGKLAHAWNGHSGSVADLTLADHVAERLRWDKDMAGAEVQVHAVGPGVVQLRGNVADLTQRTRAMELARSTRGVVNVLDALTEEGSEGRR